MISVITTIVGRATFFILCFSSISNTRFPAKSAISPGESFLSFEQGFHNGVPIVWTFSQPYGSGDWWPCKNDLSDKIDSLDIFVKTPLPNRVASVGVLVDSIPDGDQTVYHWRHRHPVAACLVGIAVTNYVSFSDFVEIDGWQLEVLNYVYPEELNTVREQAHGVLAFITLFSDLFIPYPFLGEKYGQAMFGHGGGVQTQTMSNCTSHTTRNHSTSYIHAFSII